MTHNSGNPGKKHVWILGLIHSGTTVFWRAWKADTRFLCFDEPLTCGQELNACYPGNNSKKTLDELIELCHPDPQTFWQYVAPISPIEELNTRFTADQQNYLRYLLNQSPRIVIDETHLHLHVSSLPAISEDAYLMHLYRRASAFVTSHLRPSLTDGTVLQRMVRRSRDLHNKRVFWDRLDFLPGMRRDEVIGHNPASKFGLMLAERGYDVKRIMAGPSVIRLLAYWHFHYHYLEQEGSIWFPGRFKSVRYEDFAIAPRTVMCDLYRWLCMDMPEKTQYAFVHAPKPAFRERDPRWQECARIAGFSEEEIEALL